MKVELKIHKLPYLVATLALLVASAPTLWAQCVAKDAGIHVARYQQDDTFIDVSLTKRVNETDLSTAGQGAQWTLEDLSVSPKVPIPISAVQIAHKMEDGTSTSVVLNLSGPLDVNRIYRLSAPSLTFLGCTTKKDEKPEALVRLKEKPVSGTPGPQEAPEKKNYYVRNKSNGRDDSDVYLNGTIEGASGGKPQFGSDIKLQKPFAINEGRNIDIRPYFNLKTSSTKNGNADSMGFGARFGIPFANSDTGPIRYLLWNPAPGFESDRRFRNVNLLLSNTLTFGIPGNKRTFKRRIRFLPFIGYEIGRNLRHPVKDAEGRGLSRAIIGGTLYVNYDYEEDRSLSFQVDYIRRFLLRREVSFKEDDDKKLIPLFVGKGPRDYLKVTTEYDFSKYTGFALSYEYGRLPPNFELVNHKYSLGLIFKFQYKKSGK